MNTSTDVGLFGGTFNPIHNAHLEVAEKALKQYELSKVIFIPSKIPPHKQNEDIPSARSRYEMVEIAIEGNEDFLVSDVEMNRCGPSYTVDTINQLLKDFPNLSFIVGADNLIHIETWKSPETLLNLCPFIVAPRRGYGPEDFS